MENCDIPYHIDFSPLKEVRAERVVLQLPDGLKQYAACLSGKIQDLTGATVFIDGDSSFGACDLHWPRLAHILRADVIVHIGHTPYPPSLAHEGVEPGGKPRIIYLQARSRHKPPRRLLDEVISKMKEEGWKSIVLTATSQHTHLLGEIRDVLVRSGVEAIIPPSQPPYFEEGQVIGCDYHLARRFDADAFLIVAGGVFHALGLYLSTFKPLLQLDPYRGELIDRTREFEKFYGARLYKVSQAMNAKSWGVVVGLKTGQYRPWLVDKLVKLIESRGGTYHVYVMEHVDEQRLRTIDSPIIDAWVITSCPRIPLDDLHRYEKPVLTPGEARMALQGSLEPYLFPW
ncbi:MAG: diphthamide biosynthesis enzyme Dph2 [Crenarchaeota archaeon]|nr:diphthamide biosynthesis enzyme Dph2 [Thermoproteota archaeon]